MSLSEHSPTKRFSRESKSYDATRPRYPVPLLVALLDGFERTKSTLAVDVGAGTGISSRFLADTGIRVIAVEPNDEMRQRGLDSSKGQIEFLKGTAETTGLEAGNVHLVSAFQSFHWFKYEQALEEFHRILRHNGRVALVWNVHDVRGEFTQAFNEILKRYGDAEIAACLQQKQECGRHLLRSSLYVGGRKVLFPSKQALDANGLLARLNTITYLPHSGPKYEEMVNEARAAFNRLAKSGVVELVYQTTAFIAERG